MYRAINRVNAAGAGTPAHHHITGWRVICPVELVRNPVGGRLAVWTPKNHVFTVSGTADPPASRPAEFVYGGSRWLWLVNSANTGATFRLSGWPNEPRVWDAFTGKAIDVGTGSPRELTLPAYGVMAMRWTDGAGGAAKL